VLLHDGELYPKLPKAQMGKVAGREILCVSLKWWGYRIVEGHKLYPKLPKAKMGKKGGGLMPGRGGRLFPKSVLGAIGYTVWLVWGP
jgi:hypothetical protein